MFVEQLARRIVNTDADTAFAVWSSTEVAADVQARIAIAIVDINPALSMKVAEVSLGRDELDDHLRSRLLSFLIRRGHRGALDEALRGEATAAARRLVWEYVHAGSRVPRPNSRS